MKKRKNFWKIIFMPALAVAAVCAQTAFAQPVEEGEANEQAMEARGRAHFQEMAKKLKLSAQQQAQLDAGREKHRQVFAGTRKNLAAKREALRVELEKTELDMNKIKQIHNDLKTMMAAAEDERLNAILEVRAILTPEQFKQFFAERPDRHGRFGKDKPRAGYRQ